MRSVEIGAQLFASLAVSCGYSIQHALMEHGEWSHGAWRAVLSGECPEGAASAVSLKLTPHPTLAAAAAGMLSADGRCKTWDARANGYAR